MHSVLIQQQRHHAKFSFLVCLFLFRLFLLLLWVFFFFFFFFLCVCGVCFFGFFWVVGFVWFFFYFVLLRGDIYIRSMLSKFLKIETRESIKYLVCLTNVLLT